MQDDRLVKFLSDGEDNVRELQRFISPLAKHMLDWFHISMRFTVLMNYAKAYQKYDKEEIDIFKELESAKRHLRHGHAEKCYEKVEDVSGFMN